MIRYQLQCDSQDELLKKIMSMLGFRNKLIGSTFLYDAIMLYKSNPVNMHRKLTVELYPTIGKCYDTTGNSVNKNIRTAIQDSYERGKLKLLNEMLGYDAIEKEYPPTNADIISLLTTALATIAESNEVRNNKMYY